MRLFKKKNLREYSQLENYKVNIEKELINSPDHLSFFGETGKYNIYIIKDNGKSFLLRQDKRNPSNVCFLGETRHLMCLYEDRVFMTDGEVLRGDHYLRCLSVETGEKILVNALSDRDCYINVGGMVHVRNQDFVKAFNVQREYLAVDVQRYKEHEYMQEEFIYHLHIKVENNKLNVKTLLPKIDVGFIDYGKGKHNLSENELGLVSELWRCCNDYCKELTAILEEKNYEYIDDDYFTEYDCNAFMRLFFYLMKIKVFDASIFTSEELSTIKTCYYEMVRNYNAYKIEKMYDLTEDERYELFRAIDIFESYERYCDMSFDRKESDKSLNAFLITPCRLTHFYRKNGEHKQFSIGDNIIPADQMEFNKLHSSVSQLLMPFHNAVLVIMEHYFDKSITDLDKVKTKQSQEKNHAIAFMHEVANKIIDFAEIKIEKVNDICFEHKTNQDSRECAIWTLIMISAMACALYYKRIEKDEYEKLKKDLITGCKTVIARIGAEDYIWIYYTKQILPLEIDKMIKSVASAFNQNGCLQDDSFVVTYLNKFIKEQEDSNKIYRDLHNEIGEWLLGIKKTTNALEKGSIHEKEIEFIFNNSMRKINYLNEHLTNYGGKAAIEMNKEAFVVETLFVYMYFYEILLIQSGYSKENIFEIMEEILSIMEKRISYYDLDELYKRYDRTRIDMDSLPNDEQLKELNPFVAAAIYYLNVSIKGFDTGRLSDSEYEQLLTGIVESFTDILSKTSLFE